MDEVLEDTQLHKLFGGAIELEFPQRLVDVSDFRPVPDNQEVFADSAQDQSLIVEILEYQGHVEDAAVTQHMFKDLAEQNDAIDSTFDGALPSEDWSPPDIKHATTVLLSSGRQIVKKGRQQDPAAANDVQVLLAAIRLPQYKTDLVVSLNSPITIAQHSVAAADAGAGSKRLHDAAPDKFRTMLSTLHIRDYALFGTGTTA